MSAVTVEQALDLCSSLPGAVEDYPFGDDVAVIEVGENSRSPRSPGNVAS